MSGEPGKLTREEKMAVWREIKDLELKLGEAEKNFIEANAALLEADEAVKSARKAVSDIEHELAEKKKLVS